MVSVTLYKNCAPESTKIWGQGNPDVNDYHFDLMEISSTFGVPDITD
jgi:hypothetical protein